MLLFVSGINVFIILLFKKTIICKPISRVYFENQFNFKEHASESEMTVTVMIGICQRFMSSGNIEISLSAMREVKQFSELVPALLEKCQTFLPRHYSDLIIPLAYESGEKHATKDPGMGLSGFRKFPEMFSSFSLSSDVAQFVAFEANQVEPILDWISSFSDGASINYHVMILVGRGIKILSDTYDFSDFIIQYITQKQHSLANIGI